VAAVARLREAAPAGDAVIPPLDWCATVGLAPGGRILLLASAREQAAEAGERYGGPGRVYLERRPTGEVWEWRRRDRGWSWEQVLFARGAAEGGP